MNYTLNQLQIFLKVTQLQSITKAAESLHLTQPAVSIQLKNFQNQFSIPLTEVIGRKLFVTDFGKEIATAAEKILNEVYAINYKTQAFKGKLTGRLKLSVVSTGNYVMPYFLTDFLKLHSGVELVMEVTNKASVLNSIQNNETDFGLISVLPKNIKLENITLLQNKLYLVTNVENIYNKKQDDKSIMNDLVMIFREEGSATRLVMEKYLEKSHTQIQKKMELYSNEAIKQSVIAGLGCSIMPLIGIKNELSNGELKIIPVKGLPVKTTWQLVWMQNKKLSPVALAFANYIKKEKNHIIKNYFGWYEEY